MILVTTCLLGGGAPAFEAFNDSDPRTEALEIWRLTDDSLVRHHSNYHNVDPFSHDGRYVIYTIMTPRSPDRTERRRRRAPPTFAVYDLRERREVHRATPPGIYPVWARGKNTVYWVSGLSRGADRTLCRLELDGVAKVRCEDRNDRRMPGQIESVSSNDEWLFSVGAREGSALHEWHIWRVDPAGMKPSTILYVPPEFPKYLIYEPRANPTRPLLFARRVRIEVADGRVLRHPGHPTKALLSTDGKYLGPVLPDFERGAHLCWSGDGRLLLRGDGPIRGRRAPFVEPGDWKILSSETTSDVSPCGASGQWLVGINGINGTIFVVDVDTGYTRPICHAASIIHQAKSDKRDLSGPYDSDAHGSPDGTKVYFSTNYDITRFPVTRTISRVNRNKDGTGPASLQVESTEGFPDSGTLSVWCMLVEYQGRAHDRFLNCRWACGQTRFPPSIEPGVLVTNYHGRCRNADKRDPLLGQSATDVYVAVVRRPDAPTLQREDERIVLRPGYNHREMASIQLFLDGERVRDALRSPADSGLRMPRSGKLTARAVEWSGLESEMSEPVSVAAGDRLIAKADAIAPGALRPDQVIEEPDGTRIERFITPKGWVGQEIVHLANGTRSRRLFRAAGVMFSVERYDRSGRRIEEVVYDREGRVGERTLFSVGRAIEREVLKYGRFRVRERWERGRWVRTDR